MVKLNPPNNPGCYIYKNKEGEIIYVGKAKNLKKRVNSYFNKKNHDIKTEHLVKNINDAEFFVTDNEVEALLLENTLIKKHKPKYNIDLKETKRYAYIKVTNHKYPKILTARNKNDKDIKHLFGPFTSGGKRRHILNLLNTIFKLRTCRVLPKKVCLKYHINLCSGPCENHISKKEYDENISKAIQILKGNTKEVIKKIELEMKDAAKKQDFEVAKLKRDQIESLEHLNENQKVDKEKAYNQDVINYEIKENRAYFLVFNVDKGTIINKKEFSFDLGYENKDEILDIFIKQFYSVNEIPKEIIIPHILLDEEAINEYLNSMAEIKVILTVPQRGDKLSLINLVKKNIPITFEYANNVLKELQDYLELPKLPKVIECFDISNLGSTGICAGMVQYVNAKPNPNGYRKFKMKTVKSQDDFASMKEVVYRRYSKVENFPDLIIIDGGSGQLGVAREVLEYLGVNIPLVSLAKKEEIVYGTHLEEPVAIPHDKESSLLIRRIRDSTHNLVVNYQRTLRSKQMFK